jgi:Cysteine dioxygenase type I
LNSSGHRLAAAHDLNRTELRELVRTIAETPDLWQPLVQFNTRDRHYEQLWRDDHVDIWVISWVNGNDTGFHDHDTSSGAVAVVSGEVIEEHFMLTVPPRRIPHPAGDVFDFDAHHVHRMCQDTSAAAVTIHAYSPPLWRLGAYVVTPDGALRRESISYTEELRPVA